MTIKLRNRTYSLRLRVPARYRHLSRSSHVWRSLGTDSLDQARAREPQVRARLMAQWAAGVDASKDSMADYYRQISDLAAARGYAYMTSAELAAGSLERVIERIKAAGPGASKETMEALLGGIERPKMEGPKVMLSQLVATVEPLKDVQKRHTSKGDGEMKDWRVHRERAVRYFMEALAERDKTDGDKPVLEISPEDAWTFRDW